MIDIILRIHCGNTRSDGAIWLVIKFLIAVLLTEFELVLYLCAADSPLEQANGFRETSRTNTVKELSRRDELWFNVSQMVASITTIFIYSQRIKQILCTVEN